MTSNQLESAAKSAVQKFQKQIIGRMGNGEGSGKADQRQLNEIVVSVTACQDQQLSDSKLLREIENQLIQLQGDTPGFYKKRGTAGADEKIEDMFEQIEDLQIIVKKLQATHEQDVFPIISGEKARVDKLEKLETKVRDLCNISDNQKLQDVQDSMQKVDEIIQKHAFYQTDEVLKDLSVKVEELLTANDITTEVIGKLPLIARAIENLELIEEQVAKLEEQMETGSPNSEVFSKMLLI